ncbi:class I SAM-dependent methyltransferase [Psychromicrobium lacuslunae]|uniref:Ubiquinone biosynthesis protein n=1 Tax=Psychromicrobium lacuslunae TaxID=1618207 RepID=A0A0D4BZZ7_9MICC|nr:class I SAM-dependent methyltransferase [Psychromicrobium lacuslunae]AJT41908.1 ubiquinone biosynthesis protein [Psychromicrobium lacuslunae]
MNFDDGSAGDANYAQIGQGYARYRRPEPAIAARIAAALGDAKTVLNVGAGAGSYEPLDREVTAVEPSATMRAQRPSRLSPAIAASSEDLPFADNSFDASMATFTVHQWQDLAQGLAEMRRVTRGPVVILSCDPALLGRFWLIDYAVKVIETEASRYPAPDRVAELLGGARIEAVPIPLGCTDGFGEAYYGRPEMLLDEGARQANSAWSFLSEVEAASAVAALRTDLESGRWDELYGELRNQPFFDGSLVLIVSEPNTLN